jgi:GR25 family glycosyltransferase involved in LPS biosynthesis
MLWFVPAGLWDTMTISARYEQDLSQIVMTEMEMQEGEEISQVPLRRLNGIEKIYVIYLESKPERVGSIKQMMEHLRLDASYFQAYTENDYRTQVFLHGRNMPELKDINLHWRREVACFASHVGVYEDMLRNNVSSALIIEDDADFDADIVRKWNDIYDLEIPKVWQTVFLGRCGMEDPQKLSQHVFEGKKLSCTHGYALTQSFAKTFLDNNPMETFPVDILLHHTAAEKQIPMYYVEPPLIIQTPRTKKNPSQVMNEGELPGQSLDKSLLAKLNISYWKD